MQEQELRYCPDVKCLKAFRADDPEAQVYLKPENYRQYVEVSDMYLLHELLHRDEYQPVAVVRFRSLGENFVRVYFQQLHSSELSPPNETAQFSSHRDEHYQLA